MHLESLFSLFMEILDVSGKPIVPCYGNGAPRSSEQVITREGLPGRAAEAPAEAQGNAASAPVSVLTPLAVAGEPQKFSSVCFYFQCNFHLSCSSHVCLEAEHRVGKNDPGLKTTEQPAEV